MKYYIDYIERQKIFDEMINYCEFNSIYSFCDFCDCVIENFYDDWFKILVTNGCVKYMVNYFCHKNHGKYF